MNYPSRPIIAQEWWAKALPVLTTATPLGQGGTQSSIQALYDAVLITVPSSAANNVWLGDSSIDPALFNGLELIKGNPVMLSISNERQLYEVQAPLVDTSCTVPEGIPFIAWDISTMYFRASAPTTIGIILFKAPYI